MSRYIDADKLLARFAEDFYMNKFTAKTISEYILTAPSADVVPAKHGHWEDTSDTDDGGNHFYICSACGMGDFHYPKAKVSYCWNCGAKMDEVCE